MNYLSIPSVVTWCNPIWTQTVTFKTYFVLVYLHLCPYLDAIEDCKTHWCKIPLIDLTAETSSAKDTSCPPPPASPRDTNSNLGNLTCFSISWTTGGSMTCVKTRSAMSLCAQCFYWVMCEMNYGYLLENTLFAKHMTVNWLHLLLLLFHKLSSGRICYYNILNFIQTLILRSLPSKGRKWFFKAL